MQLLTAEEAKAEGVFEGLWQGELDGKAIACVEEGPSTADEWLSEIPIWFEFADGRVTKHNVSVAGTTAVTSKLQPDNDSSYKTSIKAVYWWMGYELNRETLALKYEFIGRNITFRDDYNCELADSLEAMHKAIEAARLETQRKIDEEMSNNKI